MPKRIVFPRQGCVELVAWDPPEPAAGELFVRTLYSLISIGTETTILHRKYDPESHFARMFSFPQLKTGVQAVGRVERVGRGVADFSAGELVYMRMAHGSHQIVQAAECSRIPRGVDLKEACWCGLAKTAFRAAWAGPFRRDGDVLIVGAGPVGQMTTRWARASRVAEIVVADLADLRLEHARRGGATRLLCGSLAGHLDVVARLDNGRGPSLIVDTTGNADVFSQALAAAGRFAKIVLLGDTGYPGRQCLASDVMTKGLTIQATHDSHDRDGWTQRRIDRLFFRLLREGRFDLSGLITHEFSPQDCRAAYELAGQERERAVGILFDWTGV